MNVKEYELRLNELKGLLHKLAAIEQKIKLLEEELARRFMQQNGRIAGHRPSQSG